MLQPRYGGAFARPFVTHHNELDPDLYLRIATELYLKRLIVGGLERVYEIGKDFRNEGVSFKHHPEFTMLEWYEAYADYRDTMERIEDLVASVAREVLGTTRVTFRGHEIDLAPPWRRVRLRRRARRARALDARRARAARLARRARRRHERTTGRGRSSSTTRSRTSSSRASIEPTFLHDYPVELSPFARLTDDDPALVERFEYFVGGMELGNAFTRAERPERAGGSASDAAGERAAATTSRGRPRLRRGALVRHAADGRARPRHRPAGDGAHRPGTIRDVILFPALRERV